jgi:hypothetical protein
MKTKTTKQAVTPPAPAKKAVITKKPTPKIAAPVGKKKTVAPAPAVKAGKPAPVVTVIAAKIDIGFGNALYLRGEGPGLSWDRGVALDCTDDELWTITLPETAQPILFKFLVNDLTWSTGPDFVAQPGSAVTIEPTF